MRVQIRRVVVAGRSIFNLCPWRQDAVLYSNPNRALVIKHARENGWQIVST